MRYLLFTSVLYLLFCVSSLSAQIDPTQLSEDLRVLASDEYGGRRTGENEKARNYLIEQLEGIAPAYTSMVDTFGFLNRLRQRYTGHNVVGLVRGTKYPDQYLVLSAHYDHLGTRDGEIYNGADDNASGTAALLALARHYRQNAPRHSLIFAFFDAEEMGLKGADHFVEDPPVHREKILMNINLDMVSRNDENTINICGVYDFPELARPLKKVIRKSSVRITQKHEGPDYQGSDNWTMSSDHGKFLQQGIPYLYFGVEDHTQYHQPEDDFALVDQDFYYRVTELIRTTVDRFDRKLR
jgi:Zn-dependent M28 family amino/carboxypeptidase